MGGINAGPFYRRFVSAQQSYSAAALLTIPHGLGVAPDQVYLTLVCLTAEAGYSPGDIIHLGSIHRYDGVSRGVSVWCDATNINARIGSDTTTMVVLEKTTGVGTNITAANWRLVFEATKHP